MIKFPGIRDASIARFRVAERNEKKIVVIEILFEHETQGCYFVENWLWERLAGASFCFIASRYVFLTRSHLRERNISSCNIVRDTIRTRYLATQSCDAFGQDVSHVVSLELELSRSTIPIKVNSWDWQPCLWAFVVLNGESVQYFILES